MNKKTDNTNALEQLHLGQAIYCRCSRLEPKKRRSFFTSGLPGLQLMQPDCGFEAGQSYWFEITGFFRGRIYMKPLKDPIGVRPDSLCLGAVESVQGERVMVQVHPHHRLPVVDPISHWDEKPRVGDLCAVMTEYDGSGALAARLVCHTGNDRRRAAKHIGA